MADTGGKLALSMQSRSSGEVESVDDNREEPWPACTAFRARQRSARGVAAHLRFVPWGRVPRGRGDARFSRFVQATEGHPGAAAGLPPDAIASHAEPAEVKADPREEVEVGQGGQP